MGGASGGRLRNMLFYRGQWIGYGMVAVLLKPRNSMGLTSAYLTSTKNLEAVLNAIVSAQAPERFTNTFLQNLEFNSSNDRLYIGVLKGLGFLDEDGVPTQRYYNYLDQTQSGAVLAEGIREAYGDLFAVNKKAYELAPEDVNNKLRTLTQGKKSDDVLAKMASTFRALCDLADWSKDAQVREIPATTSDNIHTADSTKTIVDREKKDSSVPDVERRAPQLHYNIQIHLPESRDPAVFDAIFRALKEHIL